MSDKNDLFYLGQALPPGVPLCAGILVRKGFWSVREYRFQFPKAAHQVGTRPYRPGDGVFQRATAVRIVGARTYKLPTEVSKEGPAGALSEISPQTQDSSLRLWGKRGQRALSSLRVGLVGAGGVGGILAEHLARLGIGELLIVDYDRIKNENFNRSQGATRKDVRERSLKVAVARRIAEAAATAPGFKARVLEQSVVEAKTIPYLLDSDVIINAADCPWARQVLDDLAYTHLIPVINGGTLLKGSDEDMCLKWGKSDINVAGPGFPCLECQGAYERSKVTEAQERPENRGERRYLEHPQALDDERAPSVISTNALVAALMQLRLMGICLGTTPEAVLGTQRFHILEGKLEWAATRTCDPECHRPKIIAAGDSRSLPVGIDHDFRKALLRNKKQIFSWAYIALAIRSQLKVLRRLVSKTWALIAGTSRP